VASRVMSSNAAKRRSIVIVPSVVALVRGTSRAAAHVVPGPRTWSTCLGAVPHAMRSTANEEPPEGKAAVNGPSGGARGYRPAPACRRRAARSGERRSAGVSGRPAVPASTSSPPGWSRPTNAHGAPGKPASGAVASTSIGDDAGESRYAAQPTSSRDGRGRRRLERMTARVRDYWRDQCFGTPMIATGRARTRVRN
jgi:hypothetical protein